jgi:LPS-assembly lipoprotein
MLSPDPRILRRAALVALACGMASAIGLLSGCGLQPLYAGGSAGVVARDVGAVSVSPIEGKAGYLVHSALTDRLGEAGHGAARYRLDVRLDEKLRGMIVRSDNAVSRERSVMRARYQLVDLSNGTILLDATADADAGIDIVASEYAVIAAEQTAQENLARDLANQIVTRVATRLRQGASAPQP